MFPYHTSDHGHVQVAEALERDEDIKHRKGFEYPSMVKDLGGFHLTVDVSARQWIVCW